MVISYRWRTEREERGTKMSMITNTGAKEELKRGEAAKDRKGRKPLLEVLRRAADESDFLARLADDPHEALKEYYTLTQEEKAALASGDIKRIEGWVGKLDKRLATWLWCRLSQEKW